MGRRGEVVEELEAVVKFYRERLIEEKAVEDSVKEELEGVAKLHRERLKLIEKEREDIAEDSEIERLKQKFANDMSYS